MTCFLGFNVNRSGSCAGYSWEIEWRTRGGDIPEIETNGDNLTGTDVNITTTTVRDGGMWLRPIRGDMLRTPANTSQVCQNNNNNNNWGVARILEWGWLTK